MAHPRPFDQMTSGEVTQLRQKLAEAEELLEAIRSGSVDAVVVSGKEKDCVYTLQGADHTYRVLIETMTEGAVILSEDGTILYCNSRFAQMVQTPIENVIGDSIIDFVKALKKNYLADIIKRALSEDIRAEMRIQHKNCEPLPVLVSMRSLSTEEMKSVCMVITDLTQQKQTEEKLKRYADELHRKNKKLNHRAEQLARLTSELALTEERERRQLAQILHDHHQQLLVGARLNLDALSVNVSDKGQHNLNTARSLIADSIQTSRSLTAELSPPILYQNGLVAGLEWLARWMHEKHGFSIELQMEPDIVVHQEVLTIVLFQSVRELLFNAVKHSGAKSAEVSLSKDESDRLRIVVRDAGKGFDSVRIWDSSHEKGGFGLFAIRERLKYLGFRFKVESAPGKGACFTLSAPSIKPLKPLKSRNEGMKSKGDQNYLFEVRRYSRKWKNERS